MLILGIITFLFFISVGYFAWNFGQCIGKFSRLDKFLNLKFFGIIGVIVYFYLIYVNQVVLLEAIKKPIENLIS